MIKMQTFGERGAEEARRVVFVAIIFELQRMANEGKTLDVYSFEHQKLSSSKVEEMDAKMEMDGFLGCC